MTVRAPRSSPELLLTVFGATLFVATALGAEADHSSRIERPGQDLGRRLDVAQLFDRRSAEAEEDAANGARDAGAASLRLDRLENQVRSLNGLIEQLQHDIRRLEEQLRKAQEGATAGPSPQRGAAPDQATAVPAAPGAAGLRRGDAFDPSRDPNAPGAPRPLGTTPPSAPLASSQPVPAPGPNIAGPQQPAPASSDLRSPGAPLDLTHGRLNEAAAAAPLPPPPPPAAAGQTPAPAPPQTPRDEFDLALAQLRLGQYEGAEKAFSGFIARNSKSKLASQAIFHLGESFFLRERHREAAEKYLEISTKYPTSPQAPEAMLRLGQSLHAIGAKEQACASFNEIAVKYPSASARVKEAAQRESKKDQC